MLRSNSVSDVEWVYVSSLFELLLLSHHVTKEQCVGQRKEFRLDYTDKCLYVVGQFFKSFFAIYST